MRRLADQSQAPFAAAWRMDERALVSNSPERFVRIEAGADGAFTVETRPIKGTRPRGTDAASDAGYARELLVSAKDRAENLMIVDLVRNDLARVCAPGSVQTTELAALRSYANVHHLVSTVRGRLSRGRTAWEAFLAAFPPGSVTGAPKVRAMELIAELERDRRGIYCGAILAIDRAGDARASMAIRTLVVDRSTGRAHYFAGGGIVAGSVPEREVDETHWKSRQVMPR